MSSSGYLPASIGVGGLTIPTYTEILDDNLQGYLSIFGANQYVGIDSAAYQLIAIFSLKTSDVNQGLQFVYNNASPLTAVGAGLDRIVKLNGIARLSYTYSTVELTITGTPGAVINYGLAQDVNGFQWLLSTPVTIPGGGSIQTTGTCTTPGAIVAEANTINIVATPASGWASVNNAAPALVGQPIETDSRLRARQAISVALPSETRLAGTISDLLAVPDVTRINVLENVTSATDAYGNPPHSISAVVEGGTDLAVATAIYDNRGIGCYTNGTTTVQITDPNNGYVMPIRFFRPTYIPIYVTMNVHLLNGGTSATIAAIQQDVTNYLNSLDIGEAIIYSELWGAALNARSNPDAPIFSIRSVTSGIAPVPAGTIDILLLFNDVSIGVLDNIVINSI